MIASECITTFHWWIKEVQKVLVILVIHFFTSWTNFLNFVDLNLMNTWLLKESQISITSTSGSWWIGLDVNLPLRSFTISSLSQMNQRVFSDCSLRWQYSILQVSWAYLEFHKKLRFRIWLILDGSCFECIFDLFDLGHKSVSLIHEEGQKFFLLVLIHCLHIIELFKQGGNPFAHVINS